MPCHLAHRWLIFWKLPVGLMPNTLCYWLDINPLWAQ